MARTPGCSERRGGSVRKERDASPPEVSVTELRARLSAAMAKSRAATRSWQSEKELQKGRIDGLCKEYRSCLAKVDGSRRESEHLLAMIDNPSQLWMEVVQMGSDGKEGLEVAPGAEMDTVARAAVETTSICEEFMKTMHGGDELIERIDRVIDMLGGE